ncbi:MAG: condensation domain-containing protein, partial [Cyanobacteria bacterium P01_F01_bin.53]
MYLTSLTPITEFTTVSQAICQSALDHGSELALCQRNTGLLEISYPDLPERVNQVAKILKAQGVVPGERVILLSENSIEWVLSLLAIFHCQATAVPLDPTLPIRDLQALITRTDACVLLVSAKSLTKLPVDVLCSYQVLNLNQDWRFCAGSLIPQDIQTRPLQDADPNLALIIFSSGTSGQPKGVMLTHQHLLRKMAATRKTTIHTKMAHQRWLLVLPLHHIATLVSTLNLLANGHCCQLTNIQSSQQLWDNFAHYQPMFTLLVPQLLKVIGLEAQQQAQKQRQLQQFQWLTRLNLICRGGVKLNLGKWVFRNLHQKLGGQLKAVFSGGAKLDADLHKMLLGLGLNVLEGYGLSETTGGITNILPEKFRLGAVGQADDDAELMIHQPDADGIGEIWVRSPYVMQGYFRDEAATTASLQNGWFHTGDLGRIDNQGVLYITGRCKEVIVTAGGKKATPEQIESHYQALANVKELAVVGVPRPEGTEDEIHAAVVLLNDASLEPVKSEIRQRSAELPYHLQIQQVHLVENLPRTATLKVQRIKLKQQLQNGQHSKAVTYPIVAPQTERQILIAKLFAEVLVLPAEKIGIHTSFFELGGHSLLATQLVSRLRETFEADVVLQTLFESPTVADLDTVLANKPKPRLTIPPIEAIERDQTSLPLSYAQERMWFLSQLEGAAATYNIPGAVRIEGFLDIPALQQAIDELVCRHESLRTTFPIINGCAVQYIAPTLQIPIEVLESSAFTGTLSDWLTEVAQEPFDLKTGPLLRIKLLTLAADDAIVVSVTMHHIISDGWSMAIFIRELGRIYEAFRQGQPTPLPRQVIQYVDYTLWQRQWLQGEILEAQLNYWQEKLANLPALLDLPTDHPRPAVQTFRGRTYHITLPLGLTEQVQSLAQQQGVTLFMTLLAAFQLLLYRYSHQSDIVVGSPIANRQKAELESLIGFFANTLVLRTQFEESDTVSDLFAKVRRMTLGAYSHQDVPFERVVEALQPERTLAHTPLFQVMFVLQNAPMAPLELSGVTLTSLTPDTVTAKFDVTLSMMETEQGLMASWEYNSDLFEADTIARMAVHFEQLLSAMVEDISQPVATLPMLTDAERYQLLVEWNDTAVEYPQDQCIHKLFEAQVELTPDAVAVVFEDQQLTYGELNARANQLAHYLQDLGVGPEVLVGLCVERSIEMVVGLLGILKAGGAYVPLDPSYPTARLEFMLTDAQVKILLTQQTLQEKIESFEPEGYLICLDSDWSTIALKAKHNLLSEVNVENLAYVIYTSGSTGIPKGVQGLHQGV